MEANVIITFTVKESMLEKFTKILESVKHDLPAVQGCNSVQIFNNKDNRNIFTLVESWESEESHKSYIERVVESGAWTTIASHLECEPVSGYYTGI